MTLGPAPPLPAPPILTPPAGWLGFLGIKSGGSQPGQVSAYLQPTMDMLQFYLAGGRQQLVIPATAIAYVNNGPAIIGTVPQGKVWIVSSVFVNGTSGVTAAFQAWIAARDSGGSVLYCGPNEVPAGFGASTLCHVRNDAGFIIPPGGTLAIFGSAAAAPTAFNWFANVWGLEVSA